MVQDKIQWKVLENLRTTEERIHMVQEGPVEGS
jgi:hypothetical protein